MIAEVLSCFSSFLSFQNLDFLSHFQPNQWLELVPLGESIFINMTLCPDIVQPSIYRITSIKKIRSAARRFDLRRRLSVRKS